MLGAIDVRGIEIWFKSLGNTEQFCDFESQWEKVSRRSVVGRGHIGHDMGSHEGFAWYVLSHMRPFSFGCHISFCWFFALKVMRGHDLWTHLQMCPELVDLLPPILES